MLWWPALLCALGAAGAEWRPELSYSNEVLLSNMSELNYSEPVLDTRYVSRTDFDNRAMGPLYNITPIIIDAIVDKDAYPPGIVSVVDGHLEVDLKNKRWRELLKHHTGPVAVIVTSVLFFLILPFAGWIWCCCRVCRSKRRRRPFDRKHDGLLKGVLAIMLIALLTLFLFGLVCLFATQQQSSAGVEAVRGSLTSAAVDAQTFLNNTATHVRWLMVNNYNELRSNLEKLNSVAGAVVSVQVRSLSGMDAVGALAAAVQRLPAVRADLQAVRRFVNLLRTHADGLNAGINKVKHIVATTLVNCPLPDCIKLQEKYNIANNISYSQMPDVSELLSNVTSLLDTDIMKGVIQGQAEYNKTQLIIQQTVEQNLSKFNKTLEKFGKILVREASNTTDMLEQLNEKIKESFADVDKMWQEHVPELDRYRSLVMLAAAVVATVIVLLFTLGVTCGVCGRRADAYGANDCCSKPTGACCLTFGIVVIFLLGDVLALVAAAWFLSGVAGQRVICEPLANPAERRVFHDLEKLVDFEYAVFKTHEDKDFNMTAVIQRCHKNLTIYKTLSLHRRLKLEGGIAEVQRSAEAALLQLRAAAFRRVTLLTPRARARLLELERRGLTHFQYHRIIQALETNLTSLTLPKLAATLESSALNLSSRGQHAMADELRGAAAMVHRLQRDHVEPLYNYTAALNETAHRLSKEMGLNLTQLLTKTSEAEEFLNTHGEEFMTNLTKEFGNAVVSRIKGYTSRVQFAVKEEVGRCGPLSNVYNTTLKTFCTNMLLPHNGYWVAMFWCVLLLIPLVMTSQKLAELYRQPEPYPGPLVDAEYMYDAYTDRDNVPLANVYKAEKRSGGGGRRGGGSEARPDSHPRRYNDMAPKHWEEGPPRYAGPTEYERPPPYYYPGSADRQ